MVLIFFKENNKSKYLIYVKLQVLALRHTFEKKNFSFNLITL